MSPGIAIATGRRVLLQLRGDHRTVALLLVVPAVLLVLVRYVFDQDVFVFQRIGAPTERLGDSTGPLREIG